ncbi:MAG: two-component regulator propeller domain-containing protein [Acidobacteriota bacterium]
MASQLAALFLSSASFAGRLPFRSYQTADGLPQSQVLTLLQDSRGELWVGTWSGAARFDGNRFRYLDLRSGLPSPFVFDIVEDTAGNLWFAAGDGVARVEADQRSQATPVAVPLFDTPAPISVRDLYFDRNGTLWAAAQRGGIAYFIDGEPIQVATPDINSDALNVLTETAAGELLIGTREGIFRVAQGVGRRWEPEPGPWNQPITLLAALADGTLLFSTPDGTWRWHQGAATEIKQGDRPIAFGRAIATDSTGSLWIAGENGLYRQQTTGEMTRLGLEEGLRSQDRFYSLLEDRERNLWIGSDGGLTLFPGDLFRIFLAGDGLTDASIWSLGLDIDGRLLIGTDSSVFHFDGQEFSPLARPNPLQDKMVRAILVDAAGRRWFGTRNDGLFMSERGSWRQFEPPEFPAQRVYSAHLDRHGVAWFATRRGLARYGDSGFRTWDSSHGLPSSVVLTVGEDPEGNIVAATSAGMARFDNGRFVIPQELEALSGIAVRAFVYASNGTLWAGTDGRGLYRRDGDRWSILLADRAAPGVTRDGPSDDFTWGLIEDAGGRIWLATNHGLDLYNGDRWINFSKQDGLLEDELSANAALATPDGATWFGFSNNGGLVRFPPELPDARLAPPIVRITAVETATKRLVEEPFELSVPWNERDITFSFVGISFRDARRVVYRSRLEGYDSEFSAPSSDTSVRYTNLGPGTYRFLVEASGADGRWTAARSAVQLTVEAPFWRRGWFMILCGIALGTLIATSHRLRLRRVQSEKRALEARVAERTSELLDEKRRVEDALAEVKTLSGLLPICSSCKNVRNDRGYWERIETYIRDRSEAEFTHGLCPDCIDTYLSELPEDELPGS